MLRKILGALLISLFVCAGTAQAATDVIRYTLLPGSTITPFFGANPVGPTEPLAGNFDWIQFQCSHEGSIICYDATRLDFHSTSYQIQLNTDMNDLVTSIFTIFIDSSLTYFAEIVDVTGLGSPIDSMSSDTDGSYSGPPDRPSLLIYLDVSLTPVDGGVSLARLNIIAALDSDGDGVPDNLDRCPNTAAGLIVDAEGCSIDQLVPCAGPVAGGLWKNHGDYLSAIADTANAFRSAGFITEDKKGAIVALAAQSMCGRK